jgi:hypothetical protein
MRARELEAALHDRYVAIYRWVGVIETIGVSAGLLLHVVQPLPYSCHQVIIGCELRDISSEVGAAFVMSTSSDAHEHAIAVNPLPD